MSKKGKSGSRTHTSSKANPTVKDPREARGRSRDSRKSSSGGAWWEWAAGLLAAAIVLTVSLGYDSGVYALYFTPRIALLYPIAFAFVLVSLWAVRRGEAPSLLRLDWLDMAAGLFILWQVVSVVFSETKTLAWFGVLNRGGGALLWVTGAVLFVTGRRVLRNRLPLTLVGMAAALALTLAGVSALVQLAGGTPPWHGAQVFLDQGRMTGTTGNPVNLAGLSLLALFVGGLALVRKDLGVWVRGLLTVGAVCGVACVVLPVSRAGYLGWGSGLLVGAVVLGVARRWRSVAVVLAVGLVVGACALAYNPRGEELMSAAGSATGAQGEATLSESDQSRVEFWRIGADALGDRPLAGWGQGAYVVAYRALVSPESIFARPNVAVSDPHQATLLLGAGSGIPGLILGLVLLLGPPALLVWRAIRRPVPDPGPLLPAAAYGIGAFVYLQVSPVDPVVLIPLMLAASAVEVGDLRATLAVPLGRVGPWARGALSLLVAAAVIWAIVDGSAFYRADRAFGESMRTGESSLALTAHQLSPRVSEYAQVAGGLLWRRGVRDGERDLVDRGEAVLREGLRADPASVAIRAELARLYVATDRPKETAEVCREGLTFSPHYPILQGLWAYAALVASSNASQAELGDALASELEAYPVDSPDGWYWLSRVRAQQGRAEQAALAQAKAADLAPNLKEADYQRRLETGQ